MALPLRCVLPMATPIQADDTLMVISGGVKRRITPRLHTRPTLFSCAIFRVFLLCMCPTLCLTDNGVSKVAARTLHLRCMLPMATHAQADDTVIVFKGCANCRITPGPHTQQFGGARRFFFILKFFILSVLHMSYPLVLRTYQGCP